MTDESTVVLGADANISVDVDALHCYRDIHGLPHPPATDHPDPLWTVGVERARRQFADLDISATFFVVGRDLEIDAHRQIARRLVDEGHEVANHTYDHRYDLRHLPELEIAHQIESTNRIIADATGQRPVGLRTPGYNVSADIIAMSRRAGHRYDASIFPCLSYWLAKAMVMGWRRLRGEPSRSDRTDPKHLLAPRQPYFPDPLDCWHPAPSPMGYVEIPVATFGARMIPIIGTSLHLLDTLDLTRIWPHINRQFPAFFNLEMHAIDFVDHSDLADENDVDRLLARQPDLRIEWPTKRTRLMRLAQAMVEHRKVDTLAAATASLQTHRERAS